MKSFFKNNWQIFILITLSVIFFFVYASFAYITTHSKVYFASPDATANYFWIERFAQGKTLYYSDPVNLIANDIAIPRSLRADNGIVKPVSFLGIVVLYGILAKIIGIWSIPYLSALFAIVGIWFFYGIIQIIFNKHIGFWSSLLLFFLPPYWYYAERGLFHNILFIFLLLGSIYLLLLCRNQNNRLHNIYIIFSGLLLGLAIFTRTSELVWLLPSMILVFVAYINKNTWQTSILFFLGFVIALMPLFYYNQVLYGGYFHFGYASATSNASTDLSSVEDVEKPNSSFINYNLSAIMPFGIHLKTAADNFINYYVYIFWYFFWLAFVGGLLFLFNWMHINKDKKIYFILFLVISIVLGIFYGSWSIQDSIAKHTITIGSSYTRYWLPMYIMSLPLVIIAWQYIWRLMPVLIMRKNMIKQPGLLIEKQNFWLNIITTTFVIFAFLLSYNIVVNTEGEGLWDTALNLYTNKNLTEHVLSNMDNNAVVITQYLDKFIWPQRAVIAQDIFSDSIYHAVSTLSQAHKPVYYYGFILQPEHLALLNNKKLIDFGLQIKTVEIYRQYKLGLYQIINNNTQNNE